MSILPRNDMPASQAPGTKSLRWIWKDRFVKSQKKCKHLKNQTFYWIHLDWLIVLCFPRLQPWTWQYQGNRTHPNKNPNWTSFLLAVKYLWPNSESLSAPQPNSAKSNHLGIISHNFATAPSCWCVQLSGGQGWRSGQPRQQAMKCASHDSTTWASKCLKPSAMMCHGNMMICTIVFKVYTICTHYVAPSWKTAVAR